MRARELVGWNIRRLRLSRDESQEALADRTGIDRAHVGKIERGKANPTVDMLENLAQALEATVGDLFKAKRPRARTPKPLKKGPKGTR